MGQLENQCPVRFPISRPNGTLSTRKGAVLFEWQFEGKYGYFGENVTDVTREGPCRILAIPLFQSSKFPIYQIHYV